MEKSQEKEQTGQQAEYARGQAQEAANKEGAHPGLHPDQEPKYTVNEKGEILNRDTGKAIPVDEPVFILRAQDKHALDVLRNYVGLVSADGHRAVVTQRIEAFEEFAKNNSDRMKNPDSAPLPPKRGNVTDFPDKKTAA